MSEFTRKELRACVGREIKMRNRVYPRWVESGKMSQAHADKEIRMMMEIAQEFEAEDLFHGN